MATKPPTRQVIVYSINSKPNHSWEDYHRHGSDTGQKVQRRMFVFSFGFYQYLSNPSKTTEDIAVPVANWKGYLTKGHLLPEDIWRYGPPINSQRIWWKTSPKTHHEMSQKISYDWFQSSPMSSTSVQIKTTKSRKKRSQRSTKSSQKPQVLFPVVGFGWRFCAFAIMPADLDKAAWRVNAAGSPKIGNINWSWFQSQLTKK